MRLAVVGLSITSSWGNGHATTYRALLREMARRGHEIVFLERDVPWYAENRDLPTPGFCTTHLYDSPRELRARHGDLIATADAVILGSYVPDGIEIGHWICDRASGIKAFYDIDTPVTLASLARGDCQYLSPDLVPRFDVYFSFTGGPTLRFIEDKLGAPRARALYCAVDVEAYRPLATEPRLDLGYLGTYSRDRQEKLERLLLEPARALPDRAFAVAGPQYPDDVAWPGNVERAQHIAPADHPAFYAAQRFTLNLTRADMVAAGWSPSVRLFEAGACGVPIVSDVWPGLETFFRPGTEIFLTETSEEVIRLLTTCSEEMRRAVGAAARERVLREHSAAARAREIEAHLLEADDRARRARPAAAE